MLVEGGDPESRADPIPVKRVVGPIVANRFRRKQAGPEKQEKVPPKIPRVGEAGAGTSCY